MELKDSLQSQKVFAEDEKIPLDLVTAHAVLTKYKPEDESVTGAYVAGVVLPCGTLHLHTLEMLQKESMERLGYKVSPDWEKSLWRHLTWHDVVLWLMLPDLSEKFDYHPMHDELNMMKAVHQTCRERDERKYKLIYGILSLQLPKE